jgi:glycosyltransferase involved in cell wall biosynthesis
VHVALPEPVSLNVPPASGFVHLLSAGAARADKGFEHIVALAEVLAADVDATAPALVVQASGDHYGRYDSATSALLERLQRLPAQRVRVIRAPVPLQEYARLFEGSICLQPYRPHDYADKVSGITLDALRAGAPIITTANTWMARIVEDTGAGEVVTTTDPSTLLAAADRLRADYPQFQQRALRASARLSAQAGLAPLAAALRAAAAAAVQP